jgi:hypothetical protein
VRADRRNGKDEENMRLVRGKTREDRVVGETVGMIERGKEKN